MNDMTPVIQPKSDQLNAEDFIAGPRTYMIDSVEIRGGTEQPVSIRLVGEDRVWRPCKSMSRVLVAAWGPDANAYRGRSVTLYRDPKVKWAGLEVGGIRISHLSHIDRDMVMALTATKGKRAPHTVKPLKQSNAPSPSQPSEAPSPAGQSHPSAESEAADGTPAETLYDHQTGGEETPSPASQALAFEDALKAAQTEADLAATWKANVDLVRRLKADEPALFAAVNKAKDERKAALASADDGLGY